MNKSHLHCDRESATSRKDLGLLALSGELEAGFGVLEANLAALSSSVARCSTSNLMLERLDKIEHMITDFKSKFSEEHQVYFEKEISDVFLYMEEQCLKCHMVKIMMLDLEAKIDGLEVAFSDLVARRMEVQLVQLGRTLSSDFEVRYDSLIEHFFSMNKEVTDELARLRIDLMENLNPKTLALEAPMLRDPEKPIPEFLFGIAVLLLSLGNLCLLIFFLFMAPLLFRTGYVTLEEVFQAASMCHNN